MDPLAHTLVGASLAQTPVRRWTSLAGVTLLVGANLPDVDAVMMLVGRDVALGARRGWTHGLLAMGIWPFVLAGAVWLVATRLSVGHRRRLEPPRFVPLLGLSAIGVLSHPALDWLNTYGIRLLMPFGGRWFYGDALFIIDPWVWLLAAAPVVLAGGASSLVTVGWALLGGVTTLLIVLSGVAPFGAQLVWGAAIVALIVSRLSGRLRPHVASVACVCLLVLVAYIGAMRGASVLAHWQAIDWLVAERAEVATRAIVNPVAANPFAREVILETSDHYRVVRVDWLAETWFTESGHPIPIAGSDPVIRAALAAPSVQGMRGWLRVPSYEVQPRGTGYRVIIRDLRYSRFGRTGIGLAAVDLDENLQPVRP